MAEKTEKATPKKLRDAKKKGQVAKSQDFPSAFTFVTAIVGTLMASGYLYKQLATYILVTFKAAAGNIDLQHRAGGFLMEAINVIMICSFPIVIVVAMVGILANFLIIGPLFSFEAMKFDLKKLNPVEGIKQKFKLKVLVELLKSILKITGAAIIIYLVIKSMLPQVITSVKLPVIGSATIIDEFLKRVTIQVGIFFLLVALFDLSFQKRQFGKEMMMEKFELKQEYKDTEGDPMIKGKRRERFREIAYSEGPSAARRARAIVTNPTHIAVALGFEEEKDPVPTILTMGQGSMAATIIKLGVENHIPIMRNVELARKLFNVGKVGDYVPKETYKAVAEILKWLETMEEMPDVNIGIFQ
ncbi:MAG: type III secretion system export apparatus subunit SctU [Parachlamydiales bacterium]|nr:type III secretion system export apparatus subunit SctU [Parachlamydiales bacterium]